MGILSCNKLVIINKPVLVPIITDQDGVYHHGQFIVFKNLGWCLRMTFMIPMVVTGVVRG